MTITPATGNAKPKSLVIAYVLWFFLGSLGAHRFYLGLRNTAITQLVLAIGGWILIATLVGMIVGFPMIFAWSVWMLMDAILMFKLVRTANGGDPLTKIAN